MSKIETLTPEEETLIPIVRDEWIKIGLATGAADREAAQAAIADAHRMVGLEPPKTWIWLGSPWAGCVAASQLMQLPVAQDSLRNQLEELAGYQRRNQLESVLGFQVGNQIRDQVEEEVIDLVTEQVRTPVWVHATDRVGDQVWCQVGDQVTDQMGDPVWHLVLNQMVGGLVAADWLSYYDFFRRTKRVRGPDRMEPLMRLATMSGWWWAFEDACIITERPAVLHRDEAGSLHAESSPAVAYPDSWAVHAWHGMRVPSWVIEEKHRITPDTIDAEVNAELRRVMLEIFGFDKYIEARGARLIAEDECLGLPRQLFEIDLGGEPVRLLRVVKGTVEADGRQLQFHLGVPLECSTPQEAVAWSYGRPTQLHREALRT